MRLDGLSCGGSADEIIYTVLKNSRDYYNAERLKYQGKLRLFSFFVYYDGTLCKHYYVNLVTETYGRESLGSQIPPDVVLRKPSRSKMLFMKEILHFSNRPERRPPDEKMQDNLHKRGYLPALLPFFPPRRKPKSSAPASAALGTGQPP